MKFKKVDFSIIIIVTAFVILFAIGFSHQENLPEMSGSGVRATQTKSIIDPEQASLQQLKKEINEYLKDNKIKREQVAYVITDLETGVSISQNAKQDWFAASTYKLPLAMLYYDMEEEGDIDLDEAYYRKGKTTYRDLIEATIVDSNNYTAEILFKHLGGWQAFKKQSAAYSDRDLSKKFFSMENLTSASYMDDVLQHLYRNKKGYKELLSFMKKSQPDNYLNASMDTQAYQKYGNYDSYHNSVGLILSANTPYSIAIFTDSIGYGNTVIGEIYAICYEFFDQ